MPNYVSLDITIVHTPFLNPRTDGGLGQLCTDGGGGYLPTVRYQIRNKLETSSKRHWIQADKTYKSYEGHFPVR